MRLYLLTPAAGVPCLRRRQSLDHATRRALQEFPDGPCEVRHVPPESLAAVVAGGAALPSLLRAALANSIKAKERKAARTLTALQKRIEARTAQTEARRAQRAEVLHALQAARKVAKAAEAKAERAARKASKGELVAPREGIANPAVGLLSVHQEEPTCAPWEDSAAPAK